MNNKKIKAIGLLSGGLDSILAVKIILDQGIEVIPVHFLMPFMRSTRESIEASSMKAQCDRLGVPLRVRYLGDEYMQIVRNPSHGHGKNLNPCIDCKILFLHEAVKLMQDEGASFIFTGEVIGQRPMSQQSWALDLIEKEAGLAGLLLRPLSALKMTPTIPEEKGWVDRSKLFGITGRSRKAQIRLAAELGIEDFPNPAGGCLLTEKFFCARLDDLLRHEEASIRNIELLKFGRFFRLTEHFFLIVGRNQADNQTIVNLADPQDCLLSPETLPGPTGLGVGTFDPDTLDLAMGIIARYTDSDAETVRISLSHKGQVTVYDIPPVEETELREHLV